MKYYLGIESSCDETSVSLLAAENIDQSSLSAYLNSFKVLSNVVSSQIETHIQYGGIVPEIGARSHANQIHLVFEQALEQAGLSIDEFKTGLEKIYVTSAPGLMSALRVGMEFAKSLSYYLDTEVQYVNHLDGHLYSGFYSSEQVLEFPHLHFLVSGGNTQIIVMNDARNTEIIGQTLDDAAGECFDKTGRMLGLPYPAGIAISQIAGDDFTNYLDLPVSMKGKPGFDLSFSGLKTAMRYKIQGDKTIEYEKPRSGEELIKLKNKKFVPGSELEYIYQAVCSIQFCIISQLTHRFKKAIKEHQPKSIALSGGVSASPLLREKFTELRVGQVSMAPRAMTGDNAAMIALAGLVDNYVK